MKIGMCQFVVLNARRTNATGIGIAARAWASAVDLPDPCAPDRKSSGTCPPGALSMATAIQRAICGAVWLCVQAPFRLAYSAG